MGHYSEIIKKRDRLDGYYSEISERVLLGMEYDCSTMPDKDVSEAVLALQYILRKYNQKLRYDTGTTSVQELLCCALEPLGILYEEVRISEGISKMNRNNMLAFQEDGTAVIISSALFGHRYYIPSSGEKGIFQSDMNLKPTAYIINRPIPTEDFSLTSFIRFVISLISFSDWIMVALVTGLISALGVIVPEINRKVLGSYVTMSLDEVGTLLILACFGLATVYIARTIFRCAKEVLMTRMKLNVERDVQAAFMSRLLLLPMSYFRNNASGKISASIKYSRILTDIVIGAFVGAPLSIFFSIPYFGEIANISHELFETSILILIVQIVVMLIADYASAQNQKMIIDNEVELRDYNNMVFKGIHKIKTSGAENKFYMNWAWLYSQGLKMTYNPPLMVKIKPILSMFISAGGTVILLLSAAAGHVSGADYVAFISVYSMATTAVNQIISLCDRGMSAQPYITRLKPILDASQDDDNTSKQYVREIAGSVHFDKVYLEYPGNDQFKIENLSLRIRPGEKIAIVGPSGCGKSSIINLLTGLNIPVAGEILIDGKAITHMNIRSLCRQIGSVSQFSKLFPGTVRFNISMGDASVTDDEIWKALDAAAIGDVIRNTPLGLDTEVSEGQNGGFSGGQKQSLLLARCFVGSHKIMILDEATSALDNIKQDKVLDSIYSMKSTVIMVAHRLSTVKRCDRIYVMDNGQIIEEGNYEDLIEKKGAFYELVKKQLQSDR